MIWSSWEGGQPVWRRRLRRRAPGSTTSCSKRVCWSTRSTGFRRTWCSSRHRNCSRLADFRSCRPSRSRHGSKRSATTAASSRLTRSRSNTSKRYLPFAASHSAPTTGSCSIPETGGAWLAPFVRHSVILAIGYYDHPNLLSIPGEQQPHVSHYYTEAHAYIGRRVVVVGGGNSAAEAALDLYRGGAVVTLVHYRDSFKPTIKYWVKPDIENRVKEGSIVGRFNTRLLEIRRDVGRHRNGPARRRAAGGRRVSADGLPSRLRSVQPGGCGGGQRDGRRPLRS